MPRLNRQNLTDSKVTKAEISMPGKRLELFDQQVPGLHVRVMPSGAKTWWLYRYLNGDRKKVRIADANVVNVEAARKRARDILEAAEKDIDLLKTEEAKAELAKATTVRAISGLFIEKHCKPKNRSWEEQERQLTKYVVPYWGGMPIAEVNRRDISKLQDKLTANHGERQGQLVLGTTQSMFNWALRTGYLEVTPFVRGLVTQKGKERDFLLKNDDLRRIVAALDQEQNGSHIPYIYHILLLTGRRLNEVLGMKWSEIDVEDALWRVPYARLKKTRASAGQDHPVPLSRQTMAIINMVSRVDGSDFLFPSRDSENQSALAGSKPHNRIKARAGIVDSESGEPINWRKHDFRRVVATVMEVLEIDINIIEACLGHETRRGAQRNYFLSQHIEPKRRALQAYADALDLILADDPAQIDLNKVR